MSQRQHSDSSQTPTNENLQPYSSPRAPTQSHWQYHPSQPYHLNGDWHNQPDVSQYATGSGFTNQHHIPNHYTNHYQLSPQANHNQPAAINYTNVLSDRTGTILNTGQSRSNSGPTLSEGPVTGRGEKRKRITEQERQRKRRTISDSIQSSASGVLADGVGPFIAPQIPLLGSLIEPHTAGNSGASDVWYFLVGIESDIKGSWPGNRPVSLPSPAELKLRLSKQRPDMSRYSHFCCRLCR